MNISPLNTLKLAVGLLSVTLLAACASGPTVTSAVRSDLAPSGTLRAGINFGNGVLATTDPATGKTIGIAADIANELGRRFGVPVEMINYNQAGDLVEASTKGIWDVGFVAIEPVREKTIDFTQPYVEIDGVYLVRKDSPLRANEEVDKPGVTVGVVGRSNYDLYLTRTLKQATLVRASTTLGSADEFVNGKVLVMAGVKQRVVDAQKQVPGSRLLPGRFMAIRQAIGVPKSRGEAGRQYLKEFVEEIKASGFLKRVVEKADVGDATIPAPVSVK
jgi:polar amino acid transport system substrate-binding protein